MVIVLNTFFHLIGNMLIYNWISVKKIAAMFWNHGCTWIQVLEELVVDLKLVACGEDMDKP